MVALLLLVPILAAVWTVSKRDAVTVLMVFVVLLFLIPQRYVIGPLGGVGAPALVIGFAAMAWWASGRLVPAVGFATGRQPLRSAIALFAAAMVLSYAAGMVRPLSPFEASGADRTLALLFALGGVTLLAADGIPSRPRLDRLLRVLVGAGGLLAVIGIIQYTTGFDLARQITPPGLRLLRDFSGISERGGLPRVSGTSQHAIEFGLVLGMLLPLALHYARYGVRRGIRVMALTAVVAMVLAIPMALARSAVTATIVGLAVLSVAWSWQARRRLVLLVALAPLVLALAAPGITSVLFDLFAGAGEDPSIVNRLADFGPVSDIVARAPIFGIGLGTFSPQTHFVVDNQYLVTAMESGVVGVLGLLAPLVAVTGSLVGIRRRADDATTGHLAQALLAAVAVAAVGLGSLGFFSFKMVSGVTFLILGGAGALWRLERSGPLRPQPLPSLRVQQPSRPVDTALTERFRRALDEDTGELGRLIEELPGLADRRTLCDALVTEVVAALEADAAALWLIEERSRLLQPAGIRGLPEDLAWERIPTDDPLCLRALASPGLPVTVTTRSRTRLAAASGGSGTVAAVALAGGGRMFGVLTAGRDRFPAGYLAWLADFAVQAGAALAVGERARQRGLRAGR